MKNLRKNVSLALILSLVCALLLSCTACNNAGKDDDDDGGSKSSSSSKKKTIVGDWECEVDLSDAMQKELGDEMSEYVKVKDFTMTINLTLEKNGDFEVSVDEKSVKKSMDKLVDATKDGLEDYLKDMIKDSGMDMTLDEVLEEMGYDSLDEVIDEQLDMDEIMDSMGDMNVKGEYEAKDGELVLTSSDDEETTFEYELDGDTLELDTDDIDRDNPLYDSLPLEFTRK